MRDEERVHVEGGVADRHRDRQGVVDVDTKFFEAFPNDALVQAPSCRQTDSFLAPGRSVAGRRLCLHNDLAEVAPASATEIALAGTGSR